MASFMVRPPHKEPNTLNDVLDAGYEVVIEATGADNILGIFENNDASTQILKSRVLFIKDWCLAARYVLENPAAMITQYNFMDYNVHDLRISKQYLISTPLGWPLAKGVPYRAAFNRIISLSRQAGLLKKWALDITPSTPNFQQYLIQYARDNQPVEMGDRLMSINDCVSAFVILIVGNVSAFISVNCCVATGEVATLSVSNVEEDADVLQFEDILLEDLAKTDKISYVIKKASTKKKVHNYKQRIGIYIIYMKNARDLYQSLTSLSSEEDFNAHAKFLIVSTTKINNSTITETYIANIIWSFNLLNVVGLIPEEGKSETYQVYTSHYHGVCGYSIAAKITDKCVNGISGKNWFDDNTPKNLEGCQFDVRTSIIEPFVMYHDNLTNPQNGYNLTAGLEIKLLNAVAEYVNLTLNYTITRSDDVYGQFYPNSSFDGSYLDLSERKIDLIVGYVVSRPETQEIFDTISSYFQDSLVICIAHAKMVEDWNKVTKIMLSRVIVYYMIAWLVLSVFISIYITYGIKSLSITEWDYQIHTEQELMSKNILYYPICLNYYSKEEVSQVKVELCENYTKCLSMTVESDKYATCTPKLNVQYLFRKFLDDKGYPRLYCLNKDVVTFPLEMLMWKGHPLKPRINELVKRLSAGGFISKWHKEIFENLLIHSKANTFVSILLQCLAAALPLDDLTSWYVSYGMPTAYSPNQLRAYVSDESVSIGGITKIIKQEKYPEYVPRNYYNNNLGQSTLHHLRWMMQKDLLGQDVFLIGPPGPRRRKLALQYLELTNREHEYIALSRDTIESDIKQAWRSLGVLQKCCSCGYDGKGVSFGGYRKAESTVNVSNGISGKNWFDDNTPKNLEGCQFDVRTSIIEPFVMYHDNLTNPQNGYNLTAGLEIKLLNAVAEYVNLTLNYTITRSDDVYGQFYPNSSFDGSYLDLSERKIDLIVGYVVSRPETQEIFDTISSYFQDSLVICIAHAKMVEDWNKVTKIMLSRVIVYYMIAWLVLSVFMYSLARIKQGEILYYRSYDNNLLSAVKIAYGISITTLPITTICRFLLLFWIIFGFFYRSIYITYGIKSLSITEWDYQIHTEQELMSKNILYYPICLNYYSKEEVSQVKVELCENYTKCLSMTVESDKYATCTPKLNVQYLFRKFLDDKGYPRLYCLNKDVVTFPLEMLMWKGHPLKPRINELVKRLSAGGFISKWHKEIFENLLIHSKANTFVSSEELVLTISHLSQPFVIVIISHFVAIIVFLIEISSATSRRLNVLVRILRHANGIQPNQLRAYVSDESVSIGGITKIIKQEKYPEYVPRNYYNNNLGQSTLHHLRWMMQKDLLGQDVFLIGPPGPRRRKLALQYLELTNREHEYIALSRDTTESDIKQRREIVGGAAKYFDQSAVRAATMGRVLVLEGIEKAERNVLPVLNNLLENREMHLEDGRLLIPAERYDKLLQDYSKEQLDQWKLVRVNEDFRVIALGLPVPNIAAKITDKCVNGISGKNWFDDNTPKNLEGCQFDVRTSIIEPFVMYHDNLTNPQNGYNLTAGLEIKLLNAVAEYVNLTLNYTITRSDDVYGQFYPNSSFDGSYLDLSERKIDLIVGYVVSRPETQEIFDTISSYFQDSLVICIAHAKMVEDWNKVTKIMLSRVIVYYMIAWLVLSVFMYSLARIKQGEILYYRSYDNNLLSAVKIAYGISITTLPITTICRFLLLFWIIFGFFYRSIYITYGIKSLSITEWDYQIHTEQELMSKNILYYPICLNYYSKEEVSQVKVELCENYTKCLSMTVESDKYATCTPKLNVQYLFRKFLDDKGYPRLYCLNKDVVTFPLEMLMWKGHPLKPRINELVKRLSAGGFISKWHKEIFENLLIHSKANTFVSSEELVLKISHLSQPFVIEEEQSLK
ncbi:AAA domain (dynein-related subfamily) [Popillia japonica]|uniref:AAA domain (Dynein-related subfamily) n=1 Tax=Popillia japonica TaxID=7064 RepID=A0AAW1HTX1_POPJA